MTMQKVKHVILLLLRNRPPLIVNAQYNFLRITSGRNDDITVRENCIPVVAQGNPFKRGIC